MDASIAVWENWHEQVKQLLVGVHGHQKKTFASCIPCHDCVSGPVGTFAGIT